MNKREQLFYDQTMYNFDRVKWVKAQEGEGVSILAHSYLFKFQDKAKLF